MVDSSDLDAFRQRTQAFVLNLHDPSQLDRIETDVNDLMGFNGTRLSLSETQQAEFDAEYNDSGDEDDRGSPPEFNANENLTSNSAVFPWLYERDDPLVLRQGVQAIIGTLAARNRLIRADGLIYVVNKMVEPVRTIAINHFFIGVEIEEIARSFHTSTETVDFLIEVALSQLEI